MKKRSRNSNIETISEPTKDKALLISDNPTNKRKRSQRLQNLTKLELQLINCHACKTVDSASNMMTCSRNECRESFCINCIKKNYVKFNSNFYLILKEKENSNSWKCYKCVGKCPCKDCDSDVKAPKRKYERRMLQMKRGRSRGRGVERGSRGRRMTRTESHTNLNNMPVELKTRGRRRKKLNTQPNEKEEVVKVAPIVDETKVRDKIQIDEFCILECESSYEDLEDEQPQTIDQQKNNKEKNQLKDEKSKLVETIFDNSLNNNSNDYNLNSKNISNLNLFNDKKQINDNFFKLPNNLRNNLYNLTSMNSGISMNNINHVNNVNIVNSVGQILNNKNISNLVTMFTALSKIGANPLDAILGNKLSIPNLTNQNNLNLINNVNSQTENKADIKHDEIIDTDLNKKKENTNENICEKKGEFIKNNEKKNENAQHPIVNNFNNNVNIYINNASTLQNNGEGTPSNHPSNQQAIALNSNRKPLTKPCYVCGYSHFNRSEIQKFPSYSNLINTLQNLMEQRETMSDTDMTNLKYSLNILNFSKNDENFVNNRKALQEVSKSLESKSEENFRRTKRICKKCLYTHLEKEGGINLIFNSVQEEDEQPTLDADKKEEILKNIKEFYSKNGYNMTYDQTIVDPNSQKRDQSNIFNNIFEKRKVNDESERSDRSETYDKIKSAMDDSSFRSNMNSNKKIPEEEVVSNKYIIENQTSSQVDEQHSINSQKQNPINQDSMINNNNFPNTNNTNLRFLNDGGIINDLKNISNVNNNNPLRNLNSPLLDIIIQSNSENLNSTNHLSNDSTEEFNKMVEKINSQILIFKLFNESQKTFAQNIFDTIEGYTNKFSDVFKQNETYANNLVKLLEQCIGQLKYTSSESAELSQLTEELKRYTEFQKINNSSVNLTNLLKNIMISLKKQSEHFSSN